MLFVRKKSNKLLYPSVLEVRFENSNGKDFDIAHLYYKAVRSSLLHDGEISEKVVIVDANKVEYRDGRVSISKNILWVLILVVICDPVNKNESMTGEYKVQIRNKQIDMHLMWGKLTEIHEIFGY